MTSIIMVFGFGILIAALGYLLGRKASFAGPLCGYGAPAALLLILLALLMWKNELVPRTFSLILTVPGLALVSAGTAVFLAFSPRRTAFGLGALVSAAGLGLSAWSVGGLLGLVCYGPALFLCCMGLALPKKDSLQKRKNPSENGEPLSEKGRDLTGRGRDFFGNGENLPKNGRDVLESGSDFFRNGKNLPKNGRDVLESGSNFFGNEKNLPENGRDVLENGKNFRGSEPVFHLQPEDASAGELILCAGPFVGERILLHKGEELRIGSDVARCHLILDLPQMPPCLCGIRWMEGRDTYLVTCYANGSLGTPDGRLLPGNSSIEVFRGQFFCLGRQGTPLFQTGSAEDF